MKITRSWILATAIVAGCAADETTRTTDGNGALGIARFRVDDSALRTTVVGLDAAGAEIARMELTHGVFAPTEPFKEDFGGADKVDGRAMHVFVRGDEQFKFETIGYEPLLEMPAHPPQLGELIGFLHDPHVQAILDRWQLGFQPQPLTVGGDEHGYVTATYSTTYGDTYYNCDGKSTCGSGADGMPAAAYGTINTCGSGAAAIQAARVTQRYGNQCNFYTSGYPDAVILTQYCPAGSGGQSINWVANKACPLTSSNSTVCGTRSSGACVGCGAYPLTYGGGAVSGSANVGSCNGYTVGYASAYYEDGANCTQAEIENCQLGRSSCAWNPDYCYNSPEIMAQLEWCSSYCGV